MFVSLLWFFDMIFMTNEIKLKKNSLNHPMYKDGKIHSSQVG